MTKPPTAGQQLSFHATLETWAEGMDYCAVAVPAEITEALGSKGPVLVMARVNESRPFQVSLFPVGGGRHWVRIRAQVRQETQTGVGDRIELRFTVLDRAAVDLPDDLRRALEAGQALAAFQALPPGRQNFIIRRVNEAIKPETRARRIDDAVMGARAQPG